MIFGMISLHLQVQVGARTEVSRYKDMLNGLTFIQQVNMMPQLMEMSINQNFIITEVISFLP